MSKDMDIRVAQVIEVDKIVINKGEEDGIENYMEFLVYSIGEEVTDPVTGNKLGKLENPKGMFKPMHIQSKMAILVSKIKRQKNVFSVFSPQFIDPERDILGTIKVGDKVKIINELK